MTVVGVTVLSLNQDAPWDEANKLIKQACEISTRHGAENVTPLVTLVGGDATNTITILASAENWPKWGQVYEDTMRDPEMGALLLKAGQIAKWQSYLLNSLEDVPAG
jgi:hypothetical protein